MVRPTRALNVSALFVLVSGLAAATSPISAADHPDTLPRYRLEVGQELTYKSESEFKYGKAPNQSSMGDKTDWTIWVVRKNDDGSYRLVLRSVASMTYNGKASGKERPTLAYCDVFSDGRIIPNATIGFHVSPDTLFPKLPADDRQARNGWEDRQKSDDARCSFEVASRPTSAGGVWTFREVRKTSLDEIYLSTHKSLVTFDPKRGLVTKIESESTQRYGFDGKGNGTTQFVSTENHDADWSKRLVDQADRYFEANRAYRAAVTRASRDPNAVKKILGEAKALLVATQKVVTLSLLKDQLTQQLQQHDQMASYYTEEAQRRAEVVGRPAAPFEAADLKGKSHALKDFRGKVVILDFWYRGCGWCIRAMPQLKQLEEDFRDQPVAVLGMNTDQNESDAKFVIDKMGLSYLTLKAKGLPEKYGVRGFPTLVIIDKQGKVQELYVGYSPDLRQEVGDIVRNLLAKK